MKARGRNSIIRKANIEDIPELVRIRLAYLNEDYQGLKEEQICELKAQLSEYFVKHIGKELIAFIAEEDKEIIASVFLLVIEKPANPHFMKGRIGELLNVYTKTENRRQGIASKLIKLAIEEAKNMQLSYLSLNATEVGYPLYKKLGFEEVQSDYISMKYML